MRVPRLPVALALFVLALLAGIAAVSASFVTYYPLHFFTLLSAPQEVKDMVFVVDNGSSSSLVRVLHGGLEIQTFEHSQILYVERATDQTVALVVQKGSGAIDVARVENKKLIPLTDDGAQKGGVAFSPHGSYFAYTVLEPLDSSGMENVDAATVNEVFFPQRFQIKVHSKDGVFVKSFVGNHPFFFDDETLGFFSERGMETYNFVTGDTTYVADGITSLVQNRPYFGRNNTMIVRNPVSEELMVFEFTNTPPLTYRFVGILPDSADGFALSRGQSVFQGLRIGDSFIIRAFDDFSKDPVEIFSLPASFFNPSSAVF